MYSLNRLNNDRLIASREGILSSEVYLMMVWLCVNAMLWHGIWWYAMSCGTWNVYRLRANPYHFTSVIMPFCVYVSNCVCITAVYAACMHAWCVSIPKGLGQHGATNSTQSTFFLLGAAPHLLEGTCHCFGSDILFPSGAVQEESMPAITPLQRTPRPPARCCRLQPEAANQVVIQWKLWSTTVFTK